MHCSASSIASSSRNLDNTSRLSLKTADKDFRFKLLIQDKLDSFSGSLEAKFEHDNILLNFNFDYRHRPTPSAHE
jgi:hypothetical protein